MTEINLKEYESRHNMKAAGLGVMWLAAAAALWYISYCIIWWLVALNCRGLGKIWGWTPSEHFTRNAAWIGIAILAFEGIRYGKRLFDRDSYAKSWYYEVWTAVNPSGSMLRFQGYAFGWIGGNPLSATYVLSEVMLSAPRSTIKAILAFRSMVHMNEEVRRHGQAILADLAARNDWMPPEMYREHAQALWPLSRLKAIYERVKDEMLQIRIDPGMLEKMRN
jgi:hypothetical protein